jgi:hypothetical protein
MQKDDLQDVRLEFISNDVGDEDLLVFAWTLELAPEVG